MTAAERTTEIRAREAAWRRLGNAAAADIAWLLARLALADRVVEAARGDICVGAGHTDLDDALAAYDAESE